MFDLTNFFDRPLKIWLKEVHTSKGPRLRAHCLDDVNRYLIILDIRKERALLWTGFPIEYDSQLKGYIKEYKAYVNNNSQLFTSSS